MHSERHKNAHGNILIGLLDSNKIDHDVKVVLFSPQRAASSASSFSIIVRLDLQISNKEPPFRNGISCEMLNSGFMFHLISMDFSHVFIVSSE